MDNIGIVSGVGSGYRHAWDVEEYNGLLSVAGRRNRICITFNLKSVEDISHKFDILQNMVEQGLCTETDLDELREIVRLKSNLEVGGNGDHTMVGIGESKVVTVYTDGKPKKVAKRKKMIATPAQVKSAENARRYAHTPEATAKRRKSINARRDGKTLGEI